MIFPHCDKLNGEMSTSTKRKLNTLDSISDEIDKQDCCRKRQRQTHLPSLSNERSHSMKSSNQKYCHNPHNVSQATVSEVDVESNAEKLESNLSITQCLTPEKCPDDMSPDCYLKLLMESNEGFPPKTIPVLEIDSDFFPCPTEENLAAYTTQSIMAVRDDDIDTIKEMHTQGFSFEACNRFGESIIHTACRRGFTEIVRFLINDAKVSIRVRDDYGRTPLHDACWNRFPRFDLIEILIKIEPCMLLLTDKRGFTPFDYARREDWPKWRDFLYNRKECLRFTEDSYRIFGINDGVCHMKN